MTPAAALHETHVGIVLLLGDRAYKLKKPVRTAFCDFATPTRRRAALWRELELNRRLAPDVYLGVSEVGAPRTSQSTTADPDAAEPVLVMRRMPPERRLATLLRERGPGLDDALRDTARLLAVFHGRAERSAAIAAQAGPEALERRWQDNLDELVPFSGSPLDPGVLAGVGRLALAFVRGRAPLLRDRQEHERVVDGHGDLLADDIFCLDDGPRLLDCLDFDDRLRHVDGLDDAAFLAMDVERLGEPERAHRFLELYQEFAGDPAPAALAHHYIAYRATVRAKVACLRHAQGDPAAAVVAATHLTVAEEHLRRGAVRLVLVGGGPGTGKSTVSAALAEATGAVLLSSDRVRKEIAGIEPSTPAGAGYGLGLYDPAHTERTYRELLDRAEALLGRGESVVLDASWTRARDRVAAGDVAHRTSSRFVTLRCEVDDAIAHTRIRTRAANASDATPAVATAMARHTDPWPEATPIRTDGPLSRSVEHALVAWRGYGIA